MRKPDGTHPMPPFLELRIGVVYLSVQRVSRIVGLSSVGTLVTWGTPLHGVLVVWLRHR